MPRLITNDTALAALWPEWDALWRRAPETSPFLSPAWLRAWWAEFGTGAPVISLLCSGSSLQALLPLYRLGDQLLPMGVGISDYFDALIAQDAADDAVSELLRGALAGGGAIRCDLPELPPQARLRAATAPPGWRGETWEGPPCPVLNLQPTPAIPAGMRRDIRQARHRAQRAGGFTVRRATLHSMARDLNTLESLHTARWSARGQAGVLADPAVGRFHQRAAPALLQSGQLRLEILHLRGRDRAAIHALLDTQTIYFYLSGFDAEARFESPGTLLLAHMLEHAAAEGRHEAHFLRGGEAYKYAWGATDRRNAGLSFLRQP